MKDFLEKRSKHRGTFIIKVENNRNNSWHGEIVWAEENRSEKFRSALELIKLMDEAMKYSQGQQEDYEHFNIG